MLSKLANDRFLAAKRMRHYVNSFRFQKARSLAKEDLLIEYISKGDLSGLQRYIDKLLKRDLSVQNIGTLREYAKAYRVPNYHVLTKNILLEKIDEAKHDNDSEEVDGLQDQPEKG